MTFDISQIINLSDWKFWLSCSLLLAWLIQMLYYTVIYLPLGKGKIVKPQATQSEPISVIICARNEAENLRTRLEAVLTQDYPDFRVIVVNDASDDETELILNKYKNQYSNLYVTGIPNDKDFRHGKKLALTIGIKAAKTEWLLLTDADCIPVSKNWIKTMSRYFTSDTDFVLGYGGYEVKPGFVNKLIRFDTGFIAMQYFGFARCGMPYMGVGRNLAYRKSVFEKNRGFVNHARLMSGDDDIFVNNNARKKRVKTCLDPEGFTSCVPMESFKAWNSQKQRHFSASVKYKPFHKFVLGLEIFSRSYFYLCALFLSFFYPFFFLSGALLLIRYSVFLSTILKMQRKFRITDTAAAAFIFDLILPYVNLIQYILGKIRKKRLTWK